MRSIDTRDASFLSALALVALPWPASLGGVMDDLGRVLAGHTVRDGWCGHQDDAHPDVSAASCFAMASRTRIELEWSTWPCDGCSPHRARPNGMLAHGGRLQATCSVVASLGPLCESRERLRRRHRAASRARDQHQQRRGCGVGPFVPGRPRSFRPCHVRTRARRAPAVAMGGVSALCHWHPAIGAPPRRDIDDTYAGVDVWGRRGGRGDRRSGPGSPDRRDRAACSARCVEELLWRGGRQCTSRGQKHERVSARSATDLARGYGPHCPGPSG